MAGLEVVDDVLDDLKRFSNSGHLPLILKKLVAIERDPLNVGQPLGKELVTFRKLIFGDRHWRIIFRPEPDGSGALVWVIGDRDDMECYELAKKRIAKLGDEPLRKVLEHAVEAFDMLRKAD